MRIQKNLDLKPAINRIVIGDVGSGKTIVAFLISLVYLQGLKSGMVAMLAPTEVLAFQHYQKLLEYQKLWDDKFVNQVQFVFLTSKLIQLNGEKLTKKAFSQVDLKEKSVFWVGTQALLFNQDIQPEIVLVDEQHRFGVNQRQQIAQNSHFISFSATPIPRTLALTVYRSLQPHFLDTLQNRSPIATSLNIFENLYPELVNKIKVELSKNRKIYIICARVEDTEDDTDKPWSITKTTKFFENYFPEQILSVHGKLAQKKDILTEFKESETKNILIATTVVEVGVDVPEATLVIILNAERFGLSALHQIRGRVGRNEYLDNQCILVTSKEFYRSKRLQYICRLQNGFEIAEKDLELRGSGDLIGTAQSGFGGEIDSLLGLNPELYYQINNLVENLEPSEIAEKLPRLQKYLIQESSKVWEE